MADSAHPPIEPPVGVDDRWPKYAVIGFMYMAQTFPSAFAGSLLPTLFRKQGLPLEHFWVFSIPLIPYWLRWAWAPVVDSYWSDRIGRRKTWFLSCTLLAAVLYASLALFELQEAALVGIIAVLFVKSVVTSTQEIAIDAWVIDNVHPHRRALSAGTISVFEAAGQMSALVLLGYVIDRLGWRAGAVVAALLMLLFLLPAIVRREPPVPQDVRARIAMDRGSLRATFAPLRRFIGRADSRLLVPLLVLSGLFSGALFPMIGPMLVDQGYSVSQVGLITGTTLATAALTGAAFAMLVVPRIGARRMLLWLMPALPLSVLPIVATLGAQLKVTVPVVTVCLMLPTIVTVTYYVTWMTLRLSFASVLQAGTDFSTAAAITRVGQTAAAAAGGVVAASVGWAGFFLVFVALGCGAMYVTWTVYERLMGMIAERNRAELVPP